MGVGVTPGSGVGLGDGSGEGVGDGLGLGSAVSGALWSGNFLLKMLAYLISWLLMLFAAIGFVCTVRALFGRVFNWAKYRNTFSYKHAHHKY